jgi:hypothetical protein
MVCRDVTPLSGRRFACGRSGGSHRPDIHGPTSRNMIIQYEYTIRSCSWNFHNTASFFIKLENGVMIPIPITPGSIHILITKTGSCHI